MDAEAVGREIRRRWAGFAAAGAVPEGTAAELFRELDRRYREAHRHYHDWGHILACLEELDRARGLSPHPLVLELAVWYHDAVYLPGAADNEERSAGLAREAARRAGWADGAAAEARALVLATRHTGEEPRGDACAADRALLLDIDLAVLGRDRAGFEDYEQAVGREYACLPEQRRRAGRLAVLQSFLDRPRIYLTPEFHRLYERRARQNLARSARRLREASGTGGPPPRRSPG